MRKIRAAVILLSLLHILLGCRPHQEEKEVLFQVSTITALMAGVYEGEVTLKELTSHGNFGLGTFDALDGEMLQLKDKFYQIKSDGLAYPADINTKTPFAVTTFFEPDQILILEEKLSYAGLTSYLDKFLGSKNIFYAIKIEGSFDYVKTRSVPRQNRPFIPLTEVVKKQPTFEFRDIKGTLVGFRLPSYIKGINVPEYHFHFLSEDKSRGGHLIDCQVNSARIEADYTSALYMVLPKAGDFYQVNLEEKEKEVARAEK